MYDHVRGKTDREPVKDAYFLYEAVKNPQINQEPVSCLKIYQATLRPATATATSEKRGKVI